MLSITKNKTIIFEWGAAIVPAALNLVRSPVVQQGVRAIGNMASTIGQGIQSGVRSISMLGSAANQGIQRGVVSAQNTVANLPSGVKAAGLVGRETVINPKDPMMIPDDVNDIKDHFKFVRDKFRSAPSGQQVVHIENPPPSNFQSPTPPTTSHLPSEHFETH